VILLAIGGVVATIALMLALVSTEGAGVSIWYGLGTFAFAALLAIVGAAELRDRRDDWPE
jgi:membrane protein implicated in regulation of membrane protease activity